MNTIEIIFILIFLILLIKATNALSSKFLKFKRDEFSYSVKVTKDKINMLTGIEFEGFCKWLFESTNEYSNVEITAASNDHGKDLILTSLDGDKTFVECKRYNSKDPSSKNDPDTPDEKFQIGRVICQKLVGAMVTENINKGIIITTGDIHPNALEYIEKLHNNTNYTIELLTVTNIIEMMENNSSDYTIEVTL